MHVGGIGVNPTGHSAQAKKMHAEKSEIETDEKEPEVNLAQSFIHHAAGHFGNPVVQASKHRKYRATNQDIVKMRNDEVGVMNLYIHGNAGQHNSGKTPNQEHEKETED